jgi:hypothetical protein
LRDGDKREIETHDALSVRRGCHDTTVNS